VPLGCTWSAGHATLLPSQFSATSQPPAVGRHSTVDGATASVGQVADDPVQLSATSQKSTDARHS
jgi:hypothetical protein